MYHLHLSALPRIIATALLALQSACSTGPILNISPKAAEFRRTTESEPRATLAVTVTNVGNAPCKFDVVTSCLCIVPADRVAQVLNPKESATFDAAIELPEFGEVQQTITVVSADASTSDHHAIRQPSASLSFKR